MKSKIAMLDKINQRRFLMTCIGVLTTSCCVGMMKYAAFGLDPFMVMTNGLWLNTSMSFGSLYTLVNSLLLIIILLTDRKKIGLGTLINVLLAGYVVDYTYTFIASIVSIQGLMVRLLFFTVGIVLLCLGSSLYYTAEMGVSTYDAIALILSDRGIAHFKYCRIGTDIVCTGTGFLLGQSVGIGTIVTACFMGPVVAYFNINVSIPLLKSS